MEVELLLIFSNDICPAGWRLPTMLEQKDVVASSVGLYGLDYQGGYYSGKDLLNRDTGTKWWSASLYSGSAVYVLSYYEGYHYRINSSGWGNGEHIRCVLYRE